MTGAAEILFWLSMFGIFYAYFGYPLLLVLAAKALPARESSAAGPDFTPPVTIIIPVHNEEKSIGEKIGNTLLLDYPAGLVEIIIVSDGSTDRTREIVLSNPSPCIRFLELPVRGGKAAALNCGLKAASNGIVVFSDASIMLRPDALRNIVSRFQDGRVGCVSGEDHIEDGGGEGLYGRYELMLRNLESRVHSIVGASGSFYAQRLKLCEPFKEGLAPDFLSVLNTVEKGYRAVTEPRASGTMTSVKSTRDEFRRKVRTMIRGMTALFHKGQLMNPLRYGFFAIELLSHKLIRWLVPFFMLAALIANIAIADTGLYGVALSLQALFYLLAGLAFFHLGGLHERIPGKVPLYFSAVNIAIFYAWVQYVKGMRMEIWNPSKREH